MIDMTSKRVQIILTNELHEAIKRQAKQRNTSDSAIIRTAVSTWLQMQGEPALDPFLQRGGQRNGK